MKTDVIPRPAADELTIPDWVPERMAQLIRTGYVSGVHRVYKEKIKKLYPEYGDNAEYLAGHAGTRLALAKLVHEDLIELADSYRVFWDSRMDDVWDELQRRDKGAYRYKSRLPFVGDDKERQEAAMLEVLKTAFGCYHLRWADNLQTQAEDKQRQHDYLDIVDKLERSVSRRSRWEDFFPTLLEIEAFGEDISKWFNEVQAQTRDDEQIRHVAEIFRRRVDASSRAQPALPERKCRGDAPGRLVALRLADKFHALFGQPLLGQTAMIASVVLSRERDCEITPENVASWLRRRKPAEVGGNSRPVSKSKPPKKSR